MQIVPNCATQYIQRLNWFRHLNDAHKLVKRNYGGKSLVSIKYQNFHSCKEVMILLCQSILETRRIAHLHGSAHSNLFKVTSCNLSDIVRKRQLLSVVFCRYLLNLCKMKIILLVCISLFHKCKIIFPNAKKTTFRIMNHSLSNCFDFLMEKISSTVNLESTKV